MADLIVRAQCESRPRKIAEVALNVTFPLWGIASPICAVMLFTRVVFALHEGDQSKLVQSLACIALCIFYSVFSLLAKRSIATEQILVDKQGIRLPVLIGNTLNFRKHIAWQDVSLIGSAINLENPAKGKLLIHGKKGSTMRLPIASLESQFIEQFLLAAHMWAPDACDKSLDELQNALRIGARSDSQASYTDLWEDELSRRFCPSAYIALEPGKSLRNNTLKIVSHLASGGLSALYLCQLDGKKLVVLKEAVIPEGSVDSVKEKAREMFEREASLLMKIEHPSIVRILDCFTENTRNYMLLEHISGIDLRQLVQQNGPQREVDVLEWAIQVANSLKYLHDREQPILHRDLTPDNLVLRNDGQVIIVDFGAANEFIGNATGTFVGKHSYIAPEQLRGKATVHSDIYAFGCTLHYLLTGKEPEALSPSIPRELNASVSEELSELIESCTQLETADRYQSVAQLIPVLRRLVSQSLVV